MANPFSSSSLPLIGFQQLSTYISSDPSLSIFRKFATLNARNILYLQSELATLEERLLHLDAWADRKGREGGMGNDIWALPRSWRAMRRAGERHDEKEKTLTGDGDSGSDEDPTSEMWRLNLQIRELLDSYYKALEHQAFLHDLRKPSVLSRKALHGLLYSDKRATIVSPSDSEYAEKFVDDLVALAPNRGQEILTRFLEKHFHSFFQTKADKARSSEDSPLAFFSESRIHMTVRMMAVVVSSVLPILSIVVLYFIHSNNVRLGLIVLFTITCSASLAFLSRASNSEIIVATATYAAVQVVFVSGNLSS